MKTFYPYGSKERLFELTEKINNITLNESVLSREKKIELIKMFVDFVNEKLALNNNLPKIILSSDENEAKQMHSFGKFMPSNKKIRVVIVNRNLADILRTLAHEMVHYKQLIDNKLVVTSNHTGSNEENEANSKAGELMREFGEHYPIIFE